MLLFETFVPPDGGDDASCTSSGTGRIFALDYLSGEPALARVSGARESILSSEKNLIAGKNIAQGLAAVPRLIQGGRGSPTLTLAFSGSLSAGGPQYVVWGLPPFPGTQLLYWKEIF